tara:strand:+ start:1429 stop:1794 length:366 start_codon:yes stop_codon:yes gene_type:complete
MIKVVFILVSFLINEFYLKNIMIVKIFFYFMLWVFSTSVSAQPKVMVQHQRSVNNFAEIQITNQTIKTLICYVAIDGHKIYFRLQANQPSQWYKATDTRFNYSNFSTWCDYLDSHPKYIHP